MVDRKLYVRSRGKVTGPFTLEQLRSLRKRGQLGRFHEVSEDRQLWTAASSISEVFADAKTLEEPADTAVQELASAPPPAAARVEWYYIDAFGARQGPVATEEIVAQYQSGNIAEASLVWKQGLAEWVPLESLPGAFPQLHRGDGASAVGRDDDSTSGTAKATSWRRVRTGLTLALIAIFLFVGAGMVAGIAILMAVTGKGGADLVGVMVFFILAWALNFTSQVLEAVAFGFCAAAPSRSGAKGLGITAWIMAIAIPVLAVATIILLISSAGLSAQDSEHVVAAVTGGLVGALSIVSWLLAVVKMVSIMLFLRAASVYLEDTKLAQRLSYLLILYGGTAFFSLFLAFSMATWASPRGGETEMHAVGLVAFAMLTVMLWLFWLIFYIVLLLQCRGLIEKRLPAP
ncbi:MAG TPA: GYF domain-containing protein [Gemmataceae bacterium]|nr:GYF domain-containing protein [Gemmataceae bacterium]